MAKRKKTGEIIVHSRRGTATVAAPLHQKASKETTAAIAKTRKRFARALHNLAKK